MAPRPRRFGSPGAAPAQGCSAGPGTTGVSRGQAEGWGLLGATGDGLGDHPAARGGGRDWVPWWHHSGQGGGITLWATSPTCLLSAWGFSALCSLPSPAGRGGGQAHLVLVALGTHEPCPACCRPPARCPLDKPPLSCVQRGLTVRGNLSTGLPGLHLLHRGCGCAQQQREEPEGSRRAALNKHSNREKKAARNK